LGAGDFTYQGYYPVPDYAGTMFCQGITHRYIGGQLRFLLQSYNPTYSNPDYPSGWYDIVEFSLPSGGFGSNISSSNQTNIWSGPNLSAVWMGTAHLGIWWEDQGGGTGRLWQTQGMDYPQSFTNPYNGQTCNPEFMTSAVSICNLDYTGTGTVTNLKQMWGFQGVSSRCVMYQAGAIPAWLQTEINAATGLTLPYFAGCGAYASRLDAGTPSLGLYVLAFPDLETSGYTPINPTGWSATSLNGLGADWSVPTSAFRVLADHTSGVTSTDWYDGGSGTPSTFDRGIRSSPVKNYFDGGSETVVTGTVSIAAGSTALTFGTAQTPSAVLGAYLSVPGDSSAGKYLIASNTSTTSFTVSPAYAGSTNAVNVSGAQIGSPTQANPNYSVSVVDAWYNANSPYAWPVGNWLSPAPDGGNRWAWAESYGASGVIVDGPNKYGLVLTLQTAGAEGSWEAYVNSHIGCGASGTEIHVFDPAELVAVAAGTKHAWNVQPTAMKDITSDIATYVGGSNGGMTGANIGPIGTAGGFTFDSGPTGTGPYRLWIWVPGINNTNASALMCYSVNC